MYSTIYEIKPREAQASVPRLVCEVDFLCQQLYPSFYVFTASTCAPLHFFI